MTTPEALTQVLQEILAPLVEADGGELYLVSQSNEEVKLHLAGTCSGCPGAALTTRGVITPALRTTNAQLRVTVTTGVLIPAGATRVPAAQRTA